MFLTCVYGDFVRQRRGYKICILAAEQQLGNGMEVTAGKNVILMDHITVNNSYLFRFSDNRNSTKNVNENNFIRNSTVLKYCIDEGIE